MDFNSLNYKDFRRELTPNECFARRRANLVCPEKLKVEIQVTPFEFIQKEYLHHSSSHQHHFWDCPYFGAFTDISIINPDGKTSMAISFVPKVGTIVEVNMKVLVKDERELPLVYRFHKGEKPGAEERRVRENKSKLAYNVDYGTHIEKFQTKGRTSIVNKSKHELAYDMNYSALITDLNTLIAVPHYAEHSFMVFTAVNTVRYERNGPFNSNEQRWIKQVKANAL